MKQFLSTILIGFLLALSACAGPAPAADNPAAQPAAQVTAVTIDSATSQPAAATAEPSQTASGSTSLDTSYANAVSVEMQLLLGTIKLGDTDQALSQEQAASLLPLWDSLRAASPSARPGQPGQGQNNQQLDSATQAKIDDLVKQIQAVMTPAQIKTIAAMHITQESVFNLMKTEGINMGGPQNGGGAQPGQGTPPAGGNGGNGGQPPAGGNGGQPSRGQRPSGGGMVPPQLFTALIKNLEKISGIQLPATPTK